MQTASVKEMIEQLDSNPSKGLSERTASEHAKKYGLNVFADKKRMSFLEIIFGHASNGLIILLLIASVISFILQEFINGLAILFTILLSIFFSSFLESKADDAIEQLSKYSAKKVVVIREGKKKVIDSTLLVPGDIIVLEAGHIVPADCIILDSRELSVNESVLTGESQALYKKESDKIDFSLPNYKQKSILFSGTSIISGVCTGLVFKTGKNSEFGKIAETLNVIEKGESTLSRRVEDLGRKISILSTIIILSLIIFGVVGGRDLAHLFIFSVALAVAAIPEGLPTTLVILLALGVREMAKNNAVVRKLSSIETIGSIDVIATDKTGTITEGNLILDRIFIPFEFADQKEWKDSLSKAVLCTNVTEFNGKIYGDELDVEVVKKSSLMGIRRHEAKIIEPFSSDKKRMVVSHKGMKILKGAPEVIIPECSRMQLKEGFSKMDKTIREDLLDRVDEFSKEGYKVVAVAFSRERDWIFDSFLLFKDPPKKGVEETIRKAKIAGISIIMMTGDNKYTAKAIAKSVGIIENEEPVSWEHIEHLPSAELYRKIMEHRVIARATPESKLRIIEALKSKGHIVAVTGDGINDAPALKSANVGVAMGIRGTEASKETADIVLLDDNFSTLFNAIMYGRSIFRNIVNFVRFQVTTNISAIFLTIMTFVLDLPLALTAIQLLWINIIMDGPPAVAQAFEKPSAAIERDKPRKDATLLSLPMLCIIFLSGIFISLCTFYIFYQNLGQGDYVASTLAFNLFVFSQLFNSFAVRSPKMHFWENLLSNKVLIIIVLIMIAIQISINYIPFLSSQFFKVYPLSFTDIVLIMLISSSILFIDEVRKSLNIWTSA
ncbi:MAG: cation-transporting P-type ATPase [Candidatus Micrarchaeota archaeon]|nr:cation-transporting P-type ATPase [Candidatus Micrarchaeota archaeon]